MKIPKKGLDPIMVSSHGIKKGPETPLESKPSDVNVVVHVALRMCSAILLASLVAAPSSGEFITYFCIKKRGQFAPLNGPSCSCC